ncbi:MAG: ABC transporter substrate-binding protein [Spirochaetia bacterium]
MRRSLVLVIAAFFLLSAMVWASGEQEQPLSADEAPSREVTAEVLKGPTGMGIIRVMDEQPSFAPNIEVSYGVNGSPDVLVSKVLSGEVDIAALPTNVAAKLYNGGVPYKLAAINTLGVLYVVSNGPEIETFEDFAGKRVDNSARGLNPDIIFRHLLSENGVDPESEVELRYYNHTELSQLLIAERSELAVLPEPFVTRVLSASDSARVEMDLQEAWRELKGDDAFIAMGCLVIKDSLVEDHPQFVRDFLDEYEASVQWVNDNPREAGRLIEKNELGFEAEMAAEAIPRAKIRYIEGAEAQGRLEEYFSVLHDFDPESVGGNLPDDGFYLDL